MPTYEDARALVDAVSTSEFDLTPYTGGPTDIAYLKNWVLDEVTSIYGVAASVFDTATVYSTSILRDFVNRAVYENSDATYIDILAANGDLIVPQTADVATAFRYPAWGLCGLLAYQEYQVFNAFGYRTTLIADINGEFGTGDQDSFTDSHVTTEVYVDDLHRSIVQDATYNLLFEDASGNPLSWIEAQAAALGGSLQLDNFTMYTYWQSAHQGTSVVPPSVVDLFNNDYLSVPFLWANGGDEPGTMGSLYNLFPDWQNAHVAGSNEGGTYQDAGFAFADISSLVSRGYSWSRVANALDNSHYITGFRVDGTEWLTARVADGGYVSINIHNGHVLNGSYDQIVREATGGVHDLNPGVDLSFMLHSADLISYTGSIMNGWANPVGTPNTLIVQNPGTGVLLLWDTASSPSNATVLGSPDLAYTVEGRGDYNGNAQVDTLFFNHTNGQVGYWDEHSSWTRLDVLSSVWSVTSHNGSTDFYRDGADDILWRNTTTGQVVLWDMLGGDKVAYQSFGNVGLNWQVAGTGDFNGDGTDDILWRDSSTGEIREWLMNDGAVQSNRGIDKVATNWSILAVGDFSDDGSADILWRNATTNEVVSWNMRNGLHIASQHLDNLPSNWQVVGSVDTNGDGTTDIIWQNSSNGEVDYWQMHDGSQTAIAMGTLSSNWHIV